MITRVLTVSLLAGFAAGLLVAVLQHFTTTPLILAAEKFEQAAHSASRIVHAAHHVSADGEPRLILAHMGHSHGEADAGNAEWQPADGLERTIFTGTVTIGTSIGFALLLIAGMLVAGDRFDERTTLAWAASGFIVTGLAPAFGLAPELPGMAAADLVSRQIWWVATAAATAVALWLFLRASNVWLRAFAIAVLLTPHLIGAPHLHATAHSGVPAELAAQFAATSLAVHATLWLLTGLLIAWLWQRADTARSA